MQGTNNNMLDDIYSWLFVTYSQSTRVFDQVNLRVIQAIPWIQVDDSSRISHFLQIWSLKVFKGNFIFW